MQDASSPSASSNYVAEPSKRRPPDEYIPIRQHNLQRRLCNRNEFDGPYQLLNMPTRQAISNQEDLPYLPTNLDVQEQDDISCKVNDFVSEHALSISLPDTNFLFP